MGTNLPDFTWSGLKATKNIQKMQLHFIQFQNEKIKQEEARSLRYMDRKVQKEFAFTL